MSNLISMGRLIDDSWELYRKQIKTFLSVSGWLLTLAILYTISLALYPPASTLWFSNELSWSQNGGVLLFTLTNYVLAPLLGLWLLIALSRLTLVMISGKRADPQRALREVKPRFLPTLLVSVMVAFLLVVALFIGFGPSIILAALGALFKNALLVGIGNAILVIGIFVALVLAFKWMVEYYLAPYTVMLDGLQGKQALARSRQLVRERFWGVLVRLIVPKLVFILFGVLAMGIIFYIVQMLLAITGGLNLDLQLRLSTMAQWIVPIVIGVLVNPLIIITDVVLYDNLKGGTS